MKIAGNKRRILIINLTRMGDLLQMTPFLSGLRRDNPDGEITLLVLKEFEEVCSGFPFVDKVDVFDAEGFISRLREPDSSLMEDYRILEKMMERLKQEKFDTVINLSFSNYSALLTYILKVRDIRGTSIDDFGNRLLKHPWIGHFYNMVDNREINLFNYVDFIRKIGGSTRRSQMSLVVSESARTFAKTFYSTRNVSETDWVIGLQPGASSKSKRWPAESFGALAVEVIKQGAKVVLFGSPGEKELGERVRGAISLPSGKISRYLFNMIGKTSVDQLAALLERCDLLVTNDTGTMHVATAVGTRVIELSLGPVYFPETGPYGEGHIVIQTEMACAPCDFHVQCKNPKCQESISVAKVLKVVQMVQKGQLGGGHQLEDSSDWDGIQLYWGAFDEDEMLEFLPLIWRQLGRMDLLKLLYREMWKIVLDERHGEIDPIQISKKIRCLFSVNGNSLNFDGDSRAFGALVELARQGIEISGLLVEWSENTAENISAIKTAGRIIHDIDEQIELQGLTHRGCHPLTLMFRQGKENLENGDVGHLSQKTLGLYKTLFREATLMSRGLKQTVARLKSRA